MTKIQTIPLNYPGLSERIKAVCIDSFVILIYLSIVSLILSLFDHVPDAVKITLFLLIFVCYDPLFTSFFGGTIGHMFIAVRVKQRSDETKNISLSAALLRFFVKGLMGWISLLTITRSKKNLAIHDLVSGSVVVYNT